MLAQQDLDGGIFARYLDLGLSVIPLGRDKRPHMGLLPIGADGTPEWGEYRRRLPTRAEIARWSVAGAQVGLVGGAINRNLCLADLEAHLCRDLIVWLTGPARAIIGRTWAVESGSIFEDVRGLHTWWHSREPVRTGKLKTPDGTIIGDLKAEGGYGVVPPSWHPDKRRYRTIANGPEDILTTDNAAASIQTIIDRFYGARTSVEEERTPEGMDVLSGPTSRERVMALASQVATLPVKIRRSIRLGAHYGQGEWSTSGSDSEISHAVLCAMVRAGMTDDDIKDAYRLWPIRETCYTDNTRGTYGEAYLTMSLEKARLAVKDERIANKLTDTPDWKVTKVVRVEYEGDPHTFITIRRKERGIDALVRCTIEDLSTDRRFQQACLRDCAWAPHIPPTWSGRNWIPEFVNNVMAQATREEVASEATSSGYLRHLVIETLRHLKIEEVTPERRNDAPFGWKDTRSVYVYPNALFAKIEAKRRNLTPQQLWASIRHLGVERRILNVGEERLALYVFPKEVLNPF